MSKAGKVWSRVREYMLRNMDSGAAALSDFQRDLEYLDQVLGNKPVGYVTGGGGTTVAGPAAPGVIVRINVPEDKDESVTEILERIRSAPATTTHILWQGSVLCGKLSGRPVDWPQGHEWVRPKDFMGATCECCLKEFYATDWAAHGAEREISTDRWKDLP